jgi:hypothetical protein
MEKKIKFMSSLLRIQKSILPLLEEIKDIAI